MRVSLRWLSEFIDIPTAEVGEIRRAFESLGHEVDGIEEMTADWTGVTVAEVLSVSAHPDADKVRVCSVTTGGDPIQVVCGAWNFGAGAKVAFANPGAVLSGGFDIGVRAIRGVESHGMICSESELGLGDEHAGILVLEDSAAVGTDFGEFIELPDTVFDLALTPNRPDVMSMVGVARELGAFFDVTFRRPEARLVTVAGSPAVSVEISAVDGCNRFTLREVTGVTPGPSPYWMRRRLRAAGVRPISNIVDVTNYVMIELGHPLHSFDADRVRGDRLEVRWATAGESLVTLDGVERLMGQEDLVICDDGGPTSLAGTMGGLDSEVVESTTRVYMEAAGWDPPTILHMSRRHGLRSEASARFERGVDPNLSLFANNRAVALLARIAGGEVLDGHIDVVANQIDPWRLSLPMSEVDRTLGRGITPEQVATMLTSLGLTVSGTDPLEVEVPTFRPDLSRPIDLVEEIARLHGLDEFAESLPTWAGSGWGADQRLVERVRRSLVGAGLRQAVSLTFLNPDDLDAFSYPADHEARLVVRVKNPLRDEESILRTSLLPGLVRALRYNHSHGASDVALFEVGRVFFDRPSPDDPRIPDQPERMAFAMSGTFGQSELGAGARSVDFYTASAIWSAVAESLSIRSELSPLMAGGFHPVRAAAVTAGGVRIGTIGELHPTIAGRFDLTGRIVIGEVDLASVVNAAGSPSFNGPSVYPLVEFDLAFLFPLETRAADVLAATSAAAGGLVERSWVFDEYIGDTVGAGRKSLAIRFVLRAGDRTLSGDEVQPILKSMADAASALGGELRGQL